MFLMDAYKCVTHIERIGVSSDLKINMHPTIFSIETHCGLVTPYGGRDLCQHWYR